MKVELRDISLVKPYPGNARHHPKDQIAAIARSIKEFGWKSAILVDAEGTIIAGHGRYLAAQLLGLTEVPVIEANDLTPDQVRAYRLADNKLAEGGKTDKGLVLAELKSLDLAGFDLDLTGFSRDLIFERKADDDVPAPAAESTTLPGDRFTLGEHVVMCGDATKAEDVARLLGAERAGMLVSDPPYGIGYEYDGHDDADNDKNAALVTDAFALVDCGKVWTPGLMNLARDIGRFGKARVLVWSKKFAAAGNGLSGASTWEPVLVIKPSARELKNDVIEVMTDRAMLDGKSLREFHSCPKPVALFAELIRAFSRADDVIYDPFGGSGTTLIASQQLGRRSRLMEMQPRYVDVIVRRWEAVTGKAAVKL